MTKLKSYFNLILGIIIGAIAFNVFLEPYNLAATDVSGLAVIFNRIYNVDIFTFIMIGNLLLLIASFLVLGKKATINTILGSVLSPIVIYLTSPITKYIDLSSIDHIVIAIIGGILTGIGSGLVFKSGFTTGGTDILEDILCKYFKMTIGTAILIADGFVVLCGGLTFGLEPMFYSMISLIMIGIFSNRQVIGIGEDKIFLITTKKKREVIKFLTTYYNYGVTIMDANGGYTGRASDFIMCSITSSNYYRIKKEILSIDPDSFMVIVDSYDTSYIEKEKRKKKK